MRHPIGTRVKIATPDEHGSLYGNHLYHSHGEALGVVTDHTPSTSCIEVTLDNGKKLRGFYSTRFVNAEGPW